MIEVTCPIDGARLARVDEATHADVDAALDAAVAAQRAWAQTSPTDRGRLLARVGDLLREHVEEIAELETSNTGKLLVDTRREARRAADTFTYYAGWADKVHGDTIPVPGAFHTYTERVPYGVAVGIIPWNVPYFFAAKKIAPALAFGNAAICKPAPETPLTALRLGELLTEAGIPEGLVHILIGGADVGAALVEDARTDVVVFTGHHETGRVIARDAGTQLTPVTLELGGKSPQLVFDDADLDAAVDGIVLGVFATCGQMCIAGSRLLVQDRIHDELLARLATRTEALNVGDPRTPGTDLGPQITAAQRTKTLELLEQGRSQGRVLAQARLPDDPRLQHGNFVPPTVLGELDPSSPVVREEVFGPLLTVATFRDEDDAVAQANDTEFGLAAGVWSRDVGRAHRVARRLDVGNVWINTYRILSDLVPFGGRGSSGFGRENADEAMRLYTTVRSVWTAMDAGMPASFRR